MSQSPSATNPALHDFEPDLEQFRADVLAGLARARKELPCKYFYDEEGSRLFDRICELDEYYPTRTELEIMRRYSGEMAAEIGPRSLVVELGSGSSTKTRLLLDHLEAPVAYVPVDISREHLERSAATLAGQYPKLEVLPVCADFTEPFDVPEPAAPFEREVVYFPGSTIGNFDTAGASRLLAGIADAGGPGTEMLVGADLQKDPAILEAAYDDSEGVTAAFNKNLLKRINRELDGDFQLDRFEHRAVYANEQGRVEMHLVASESQRVAIGDATFDFEAGESIHTESSHKYTEAGFAALAGAAGFRVEKVWTDPDRLFSVQLLAAE